MVSVIANVAALLAIIIIIVIISNFNAALTKILPVASINAISIRIVVVAKGELVYLCHCKRLLATCS